MKVERFEKVVKCDIIICDNTFVLKYNNDSQYIIQLLRR